MLLKSEGKVKRHLSFQQQFARVKSKEYIPVEFQKSAANFKLTLNVLDLLISKQPKISQQLYIVKNSISKWYEHIKQESISKIREVLHLRQSIIIRIKKQIGIVLQQIAYYLRTISEEYQDSHIQVYYTKYLNAIKKLQWGFGFQNEDQIIKSVDCSVQTEEESISQKIIKTQKSLQDGSYSTIDSPKKKYKDFNIHKYFQAKEQNLSLQRKNDNLSALLAKKEQQSKMLKMQMDALYAQNSNLKQNEQKYIEEVDKLTKIMNKVNEQAAQKQNKQKILELTFNMAESRFHKSNQLKDQLNRQLNNASQQIAKRQKQQSQINEKEYFSNNFNVITEEANQTELKNEIIQLQSQQQTQLNQFYYLLLTQSISIQDYILKDQQKNNSPVKTKRK